MKVQNHVILQYFENLWGRGPWARSAISGWDPVWQQKRFATMSKHVAQGDLLPLPMFKPLWLVPWPPLSLAIFCWLLDKGGVPYNHRESSLERFLSSAWHLVPHVWTLSQNAFAATPDPTLRYLTLPKALHPTEFQNIAVLRGFGPSPSTNDIMSQAGTF